METLSQRSLQVLITSGPEDADRAALGLNTALVAQSGGIETHVFFSLTATAWACRERRGGAPRADILEIIQQLIDLGSELSCCSMCLDKHCTAPDEDHPSMVLREGIRPAGLASVALRAASGTPSLTF